MAQSKQRPPPTGGRGQEKSDVFNKMLFDGV